MFRMYSRLTIALLTGLVLTATSVSAEKVIIKTEKPYEKLVQQIEELGGTVTQQYKYVDAIAAEIPDAQVSAVKTHLPAGAVRKDLIVNLPPTPRDREGAALMASAISSSTTPLDAETIRDIATNNPAAYLVSLSDTNVAPLLGLGHSGLGKTVAVIDSGIRPGFPHIEVDGSVIGGEDIVGDGLGFSNPANSGHGTFVAGMISANVLFDSSGLAALIAPHCPNCVSGDLIPMIGTAPLSSIYAVRVLPPSGGAPESDVIAAMERVLTLKENYISGGPSLQNPDGSYDALDISVCNMSLGGPTLHAGRDIEDQLTNAFLDLDIVLVTSAGNAGPSGSTVGSPATGFGSLTVGATSAAMYERILRDLQGGPGFGALYRPFSGTQTAYFSSRGPNADGRVAPEIVANGFASFGQGFGSSGGVINFASGTSFSAPTVAGVAALLREAVPSATARQVRNALILGANPALIHDNSGVNDIGAGFVDALTAYNLLVSGAAPDTSGAEGGANTNVKVNLRQGAGIKTFNGNVTRSVTGLLPGERFETYYRVNPNTEAVIVTLSGVASTPPDNIFFGDDIFLHVHSAKTSAIDEGDYEVIDFSTGGTYVIPNPELGLMRVTLLGDWTNASPIDASVNIFSVKDPIPGLTRSGKLSDGDLQVVHFSVPSDTDTLTGRLEWTKDWASYPANDLDLILVDPNSNLIFDAATLDVPETVVVNDPVQGGWVALIDGFTIHGKKDDYKLRLDADGVVLK